MLDGQLIGRLRALYRFPDQGKSENSWLLKVPLNGQAQQPGPLE